MKSNKALKLLAILLSAVILLTSLAGCIPGGETSGGDVTESGYLNPDE